MADDASVRFLKVFFGIPLFLLGLAATGMPAILSGGLVWRGTQDGRTSWIVLGVAIGALYLLLAFSLVRRLFAWLRERDRA